MKKARCIRVYQESGYKDIVCEPSRSERKSGLTGFKLATRALMHTMPNGIGGHVFLKEGSSKVGYLHNFPYKEEKKIESYRDNVYEDMEGRAFNDNVNGRIKTKERNTLL